MQYYDNFMPQQVLEETIKFTEDTGFEWVEAGDKKFFCMHPTETLKHLSNEMISHLIGQPLTPIFSFIRRATDEIDTDWNIHADQFVNGDTPTLAAVWCISEKPKDTLNGTAFWSHKDYGTHLTGDVEAYEAQRANENRLDQFELDNIVSYKQNRVIIYDANRFHSAYPNKAWPEGRDVMASFFKC